MMHFLSFGTHPRLSLAEWHAIKPDLAPPMTIGACAIVDDEDWDGMHLMETLGGTVKLGDILETVATEDISAERIAEIMGREREMKDKEGSSDSIDFGLTVVSNSPGARKVLEKLPIAIKRELKARGIRSRWVTGEDGAPISPAAISKLKLTTAGWDIVLLAEGGRVHVGKTTHVQDADAWSERDYGRPARDDRAGMLPPKLARMMVNLARIPDGATLVDPFCGNGTILMEAAIASHAASMIGSDIDEKQVATIEKNNQWLTTRGIVSRKAAAGFKVFGGDARRISKMLPKASVDVIITEGTLGPPLRGHEAQSAIEKTKREIEGLWREALQDWTAVLKPGARIVGIWPSFKTDHGLAHVGLDDEIGKLGYRIINPLEGWDETNGPLVYHRQGQRVARRIVLMERA